MGEGETSGKVGNENTSPTITLSLRHVLELCTEFLQNLEKGYEIPVVSCHLHYGIINIPKKLHILKVSTEIARVEDAVQ